MPQDRGLGNLGGPGPRHAKPWGGGLALWACAWGQDRHGLWQAFAINGVRQVMRWIAPGEFLMGSPPEEAERYDDERQHQVTLSQGFWLAETPCTQELWQAVMGNNPSHFTKHLQNPVDQISWDESQQFCQRANALLHGLQLRLPTEAQWEYACRAGTSTPFSFGEQITTKQANYDGNYPYTDGPKGEYREQTVPVSEFEPNHWGLFQMHGNVWEWCQDWYGDYPSQAVIDAQGSAKGTGRVLRGGSWIDFAELLRCASRNHFRPDIRFHYHLIGLRLAGGVDP